MKCLDFQNMSTWMQQSVFSLFPVNTVTIGKHEQKSKDFGQALLRKNKLNFSDSFHSIFIMCL